MRKQNENKTGFIEAAIDLGLWNADVSSKIEVELAQVRKPLGQVLVTLGAASIQQITRALDDFFSEVPKEIVPKAQAFKPSAPVLATPGALSPFCELFTDELRGKLTQPSDTDSIKAARDGVHHLKGAARLFKSPKMEDVLGAWEGLLVEVLEITVDKVGPDLMKKFLTLNQSFIDFLWGVQSLLSLASSEDAVLGSEEQKTIMNEMISSVEVYKFDLSLM